jgi:drug/metabolite transporter (DMT)-like permease
MIIFATNPLFVALGHWWISKETPPKRAAGAYFLAFFSLIVLFNQSKTGQESQILGDFSALISSLFFSIYLLLNKKSREVFHNSVFSSMMYLTTALCFAVVLFANGSSWIHYPQKTWLAIGGQVLFSTILGHAMISYLMRYLNVTMMSTGKLAEPVMASVMASFIFHEELNLYVGFAFALTAFSLILLFWPIKKAHASSADPL